MSAGGWLAENSGLVAGWRPAGIADGDAGLLAVEDCDPVADWEFKILGEPKRAAQGVPLW